MVFEGHIDSNGRKVAQFGQRAHLDKGSVTQDGDAVAQRLNLAQDVGRQEDGLPTPARRTDALPKALFHQRVEPGGGLVQEQKIGAAHQRCDQHDLLAIPLRVGANLPRGVELEQFDQFTSVVGIGLSLHLAEKIERLHAGQGRPQARLASHVGQASMGGNRVPPAVSPEDLGAAACRIDEAEKQSDGRRLACAVWAEVAEHFAFGDFKVEIVESRHGTVRLTELLGADRRRGHAWSLPRMTGVPLRGSREVGSRSPARRISVASGRERDRRVIPAEQGCGLAKMARHRQTAGRARPIGAAVAVAVVLVGAGVGVGVAVSGGGRGSSSSGTSTTNTATNSGTTSRSTTSSVNPTTSTGRPTALRVVSITPSGSSAVGGTQPIRVKFSSPIAANSPNPTLSPAETGSWAKSGPNDLVFTPTVAYMPLTVLTVTVPAGHTGVAGSDGGHLARPVVTKLTVADGSPTRLQQLLSELEYSPLEFVSDGTAIASDDTAAQRAALFSPPAGRFKWRTSGWPKQLTSLWRPGSYNVMTKGLVMEFQADHELTPDGKTSVSLWVSLLDALASGYRNSGGYNYALGDQARPQSLRVWHNGVLVENVPANTGIAASPTPDGNFNVFARFRSQVMKGTNPNGSKYADPVQYVAYFNGGDAVHYIPRANYGIPQSLGCIELNLSDAAKVWPYLAYGTIVSVIN